MRRHDKKENMIKANMLFEERCILNNSLLLEYKIFDYKQIGIPNPDEYKFKFIANGLPYYVNIWHDNVKHGFGVYEVEFSTHTQKHSGDRVGRDIKHLNSVIHTVFTIVEEVVKKHKIKLIKIEGARDEKDSSDTFYKGSIRSNLYLRFLNSKYPSNAISSVGPWINVDMSKVYPELYQEETFIDKILKVFIAMSDYDIDKESIMRGVNGTSEKDFSFYGDLGNMELEIDNDYAYGFDVRWSIYGDGFEDEGNESNIKTGDDLIKFLENKFLGQGVTEGKTPIRFGNDLEYIEDSVEEGEVSEEITNITTDVENSTFFSNVDAERRIDKNLNY